MLRGKRFTAILLVLVMVLATVLTGCGKKKEAETSSTPTAAPVAEATAAPTAAPAAEETADADPNSLPRTETLYYGGLQWGSVNGWNPLSDNMNNALVITQNAGGSRTLMFETLYMYNMLDNPFLR
jgi:peptide/nickel transport system substrate-binding protein